MFYKKTNLIDWLKKPPCLPFLIPLLKRSLARTRALARARAIVRALVRALTAQSVCHFFTTSIKVLFNLLIWCRTHLHFLARTFEFRDICDSPRFSISWFPGLAGVYKLRQIKVEYLEKYCWGQERGPSQWPLDHGVLSIIHTLINLCFIKAHTFYTNYDAIHINLLLLIPLFELTYFQSLQNFTISLYFKASSLPSNG